MFCHWRVDLRTWLALVGTRPLCSTCTHPACRGTERPTSTTDRTHLAGLRIVRSVPPLRQAGVVVRSTLVFLWLRTSLALCALPVTFE